MPQPNSRQYEQQLVTYVVTFLETKSQESACRASGLGPNAEAVIIDRLKTRGTLAAQRAPGRPAKYSVLVCKRAVELLSEHDGEQLTLTRLLCLLVEEATVAEPVNVDNFSSHLRKYVAAQGMHISTRFTGSIFMLRESDYKARVDFCKGAMELLQRVGLGAIIFVDETSELACPHPKGNRGSCPHVHVPGITSTPQRRYVSSSEDRKSIKLLVAIQLGKPPIVVHLFGTSYPGQPDIKAYRDPATNAPRTGLTAAEYCDAIDTILLKQPMRNMRSRTLVLQQDRDPAHVAKDTTSFLKDRKVQVLTLPPRSPDLDPLDYGIFGAVKQEFARARSAKGASWEDACKKLVRALEHCTTADAVIQEMPLRLQACLDVNGRHIEQRLSELKHARR